jgi:hypothetical protein
MFTIKNTPLLLIFLLSFNAAAYICQPSDANNFEGYSDKTLYDNFFVYHANTQNYATYQIVQTEPGSFQQEYWCIYESENEKTNHIGSCDDRIGTRNTCPINIGGYVDGVTNFQPYLDPLTNVNCADENVCIDIPQTLSVAIGETGYDGTGASKGTFLVNSNGWVDYTFAGYSMNNDGDREEVPYFYKQEVNAKGELIPNRFDVLDTKLGVNITNADLLNAINSGSSKPNYWQYHSGSPMGAPADLILPLGYSESPSATIGAFSPAIGGLTPESESKINIYAIHSANPTSQSGKYRLDLTLTVIAHERL